MISKTLSAVRWLAQKSSCVTAVWLFTVVTLLFAMHVNAFGFFDYTRWVSEGPFGPFVVAFALLDMFLWILVRVLRGLIWLVSRADSKEAA